MEKMREMRTAVILLVRGKMGGGQMERKWRDTYRGRESQ